jgi:hypothetical protein
MSLLSTLLVTLAGLSLATMFVSWLVASRAAREARTTIFPIVREEEMTRARRARIMSSLTGVVAAIMAGAFFLSGQVAAPAAPQMVAQATLPPSAQPPTGTEPPPASAAPNVQPPLETATLPPPPPETVAPTAQPPHATDTPTATARPATAQPPLETATPLPAATAPPATTASLTATEVTSDTSTPAPTPSSPISPVETPTASAETPVPPGTQIGPIAFSTQVTSRRQPISPTTVFSDTVGRIYAVFPYRGMRDGMAWSQVWYFNGVEFNRGQDTWNWGATDLSYVFTKVVGVGTYRLELYVNNTLLSSGEFAVQGPAAIGGPENP